MKKFAKLLSILLALCLVVPSMLVSVFAEADDDAYEDDLGGYEDNWDDYYDGEGDAEDDWDSSEDGWGDAPYVSDVASVSVKKLPDRTVYYYDFEVQGILGSQMQFIDVDLTGMILEVTYKDGAVTEEAVPDGTTHFLECYETGEYEMEYFYDYDIDEETGEYYNIVATFNITVVESPVAKIETTPMPEDIIYDLDKDVITKDNFPLDLVYEKLPEIVESTYGWGTTLEEFKKILSDPEELEYFKGNLFWTYGADYILVPDTTGMDLTITYKDGTTEVLTGKDDHATYNGIPSVRLRIVQDTKKIVEGDNPYYVLLGGATAPFTVKVGRNVNNGTGNDNTTGNGNNTGNNGTNTGTEKKEYNVVAGANQTYVAGSGKDLTIKADGDFAKFRGIKVDGKEVPAENYTAIAGSTVVTLKKDYLNTLPAGDHTLTFVYEDGEVSTSFKINTSVENSGIPNTDFEAQYVVIAAIALTAGLGLLYIAFRKRKLHKV